MAGIADLIRDERIRSLKILLLEPLTPLLRNEIRHAIKLYSDIGRGESQIIEETAPLVDDSTTVEGFPHLQDVDTLCSRIEEHWTKIYGSPFSRGHLLLDVALFQQFLTDKLLEDYAKKPCTVTQWAFNQADVIEQHYAGAKSGSDEDTTYQSRVVFPLKELMLNQDHVEKKLLSARAEPRSGSHIQRLIDRKDWSSLATTLANDRDLAIGLFEGHPFYPDLFDENTRKRVLRSIDGIKRGYLVESHRSIGTHVTEEPASRNGFAWNVYNAIASGFGGAGPSLRSRSVAKDL